LDLSGNVTIERIALHQIFQRDESRNVVCPRYNTSLSILPPNGRAALRNRISTVVGRDSHCVEMDIVRNDDNSCFQMLAKMLDFNDNDYLNSSKQIAEKLAEAQSSRNIPGGVVVVVSGTIGADSLRYISVIKAESQDGFSLRTTPAETIELLFQEKLLLTPQQKFYKIGMIIELNRNDGGNILRNPDEFAVFVYDHNMTHTETRSAALYFYDAFLGCAVKSSSKKLTKDFYNYTKEYINRLNIGANEKVDLQNALYDYLKVSRVANVSISDFSARYFQPETADNYEHYMQTKNFPANAIVKDTTLITTQLRKRRIKFSNAVQLVAPSERFSELVHILEQEPNGVKIFVAGQIEAQ
jgi:hypothetical protein